MINTSSIALLSVWSVVLIVLAVVLGIALIALIVLSILGRKLQKKQEANDAAMQQAAQTMSLLIIDKKKMKLKKAGLPPIVLEQTPKYMRGAKVPIVKAKAGPKIMSFMCDEKIFPLLPVKKEVKAVVSGIYIMGIKGSRNNLETPSKQKQGRLARLRSKAEATLKEDKERKAAENNAKGKGKKKK